MSWNKVQARLYLSGRTKKTSAEDYYLVIEKNRSGPKSIIPIGYNKENQIAYELSNKRDLRT